MSSLVTFPALHSIGKYRRGSAFWARPPEMENQTLGPNGARGCGFSSAPEADNSSGADWRDWFVTGIGVSSLTVPPAPDISTRLDQHLQSLYQAEQAEIYQRVLLPNARNEQGDDVSLFEEMSQVSIAKALMRMQIMLFYPGSLSNSDPIRMAIAGDAGLLERRTLRRFKEEDVAFASISAIARDRLRNLQGTWAAQPEAVRQEGSMPASMMHALTRINILYRQFFTTLPEPLEEVEMPLADSIPKQGIEPATVEE